MPAGLLLGAALLAPVLASATWRTDNPLPANYVRTRLAAGGGFLYQFGGLGDKGICGAPDVHFALLDAQGSAGPWTRTTALPGAGSSLQTVNCAGSEYELSEIVLGWGYQALYSGAHLYVLGGNLWNFNGFEDGSTIRFSSAVYYARANADGSLGAWQRGPDLPHAAFYAAGARGDDGTLYVLGGRDDANGSNVRREVYYSRPNPDGSLGPWRTAAPLMPGGLWLHAAQISGRRVYIAGGMTYDPFPRDQITNAVFSAAIGADGDLDAWRAEPSLPIGLGAHGLQARHGILYTLGGQEPVWPTTSMHVAPSGADGALLPWTDGEAMPVPLYNHGSAALAGALYVGGGSNGEENQKGVYSLPDSSAPAAVADLSAEAVDSGSLRLSWSAPGNDGQYGGVEGGRYELRASSDPAAVGSAAAQVWTASFEPGQAQSRLLSGLKPDVEYHVSLRAADSAGNLSGPSNPASARTQALPPPPEPFTVSFTPGTLNLKSNGNWVKAVLQRADGAASQVDAKSAALTAVDDQPIPPIKAQQAKLGDANGDGVADLQLSFDRAELESRLSPGTRRLSVGGSLASGAAFSAEGGLRAIAPGSSVTAATKAPRFWPAPAALLALKCSGSGDPTVSEPIVVRRRGRAVIKDRVVVRVPDGAMPTPVTITISTTAADSASDKELRRLEMVRTGLIEASAAAVFGPEGTVFAQPVTLELPYEPGRLPPGVEESRLAVHYWNPNARRWERLASTVDRVAKLVRAQTSHFSTYQVLVGPAAAGDIALVDGYAFPNPVRGKGAVTLRIQPGPANQIDVRVYDLAGRRIHSSSEFTYRAAFDDGNGKGAQDTYDHVWDVSGVASGVYSYVISARKAGQPDVHKTGKLAVIK